VVHDDNPGIDTGWADGSVGEEARAPADLVALTPMLGESGGSGSDSQGCRV
jgi:hypothetical protein